MALRLKTDWILFLTVLVMVSFGMVILYSASSIMADLRYGSAWHFVVRQAAWAVVAVVAMMTLKRTPYRKFQNSARCSCWELSISWTRRITAGSASGP